MSDYLRSAEAQQLGFDIDDERLVNELLGPYDGGVEPMEWDEVVPLELALSGFQEEEGVQLPDSTTTGFEPCLSVSFDPTIRGGEEVVTTTTNAAGEDLGETTSGPREESSPEDYVDSPSTEPVVDNPVDTLSLAFQQIGVGVWAPGMEGDQVRQEEGGAREHLAPPVERSVAEAGVGLKTAAKRGKQRRENRKRKLEEEKEAKEHLHQRKMLKQRESRRKMRELAKKGRLLELQESIRTSTEELSVARSNISCPCCKTVVYFCLGLSGGAEDVGMSNVKREEHSG